MGQKGAFDVLQTAIQGAIQLRLEKSVNGALAFILGLISVGFSKYEIGAARWTMIILGGLIMVIGIICFGIVALQSSPDKKPLHKAARQTASLPTVGQVQAPVASSAVDSRTSQPQSLPKD